MKVFLIGFMACGKSTIGKTLAREMGYRFIDMDRQIVARQGLSINEIFARYGEEYFRQLEHDFLKELAANQDDNLIVATGGGTACREGNLELMRAAGVVVYLKRTHHELLRRLTAGQHSRPLIQGMDQQQISQFIDTTLATREQFYSQANITVDCDHIGDSVAVGLIGMAIRMGQQD